MITPCKLKPNVLFQHTCQGEFADEVNDEAPARRARNGKLEFRPHARQNSAGRSSPNVYSEDEAGPATQAGIAVAPCASR
jgi:hypothetical protein